MTLRRAGDTLILIEFEPVIDPLINARVVQLGHALRQRRMPGVRDVVPGYSSLGVHFDPLRTDLSELERIARSEAAIAERVDRLPAARLVEIPVRYGGEDGPDLENVATFAGCSPREVIARHSGATYRVYMLGFVPGFAYLGRVPAEIAAPRHRVPRERVPAGSVGIAGQQTGVYPMETPGGWQIIGRTSVVMFDDAREPACLVQAGETVRFVPA
jgi:KipI family sensor histidine kinase inhibitor